MSIMKIVHTTTFDYPHAIASSYNEARLTPAWLPRQRVLEHKVDVNPVSWRTSYRDYWETDVIAFEVTVPHERLTVTASSQVDVMAANYREARTDWEALHGPVFQDLLSEYLMNSVNTQPADDLADFAHSVAEKNSPDAAAREICAYIHDAMNYVPGVTSVHSQARHSWDVKSGVCQDFAHLALGALREVGIPARYVSGYLHPKRDAEVGATVQGESHAWVEWWTGDWFGFDPTNQQEVGESHVVVARAREYQDVPPLSGVFGGAGSELSVEVKMTRLS